MKWWLIGLLMLIAGGAAVATGSSGSVLTLNSRSEWGFYTLKLARWRSARNP